MEDDSLFSILVMVLIYVLAKHLCNSVQRVNVNMWKEIIGAIRTSTCLSHNKMHICVCVCVYTYRSGLYNLVLPEWPMLWVSEEKIKFFKLCQNYTDLFTFHYLISYTDIFTTFN